jgi:hypothetical protein
VTGVAVRVNRNAAPKEYVEILKCKYLSIEIRVLLRKRYVIPVVSGTEEAAVNGL